MAYNIPVASVPGINTDFEDLSPAVKRDIMSSFAAPRRFSFDQNNGLIVAIPFGDRLIGIPRATPAQLKAHISTDIRLTRAGNCSSSQPKPAPEQPYTWWLAQLIHYGLHLLLSKDEAKREIELAMRAGVLMVPEHLHDLERDGRKGMIYKGKKEQVSAMKTQRSEMSSKKCSSRRILFDLSSPLNSYADDEQEGGVPKSKMRKQAQPAVKMQKIPASSGSMVGSGTETTSDSDATYEINAVNANSKPKPPTETGAAEEPSSEGSSEDGSDSYGFHATELSYAQSNHFASGTESPYTGVQQPIGSSAKQEDLGTISGPSSEDETNIYYCPKFSTLSKASTHFKGSTRPKAFLQRKTQVLPLLVDVDEKSTKFEFDLKRDAKSVPQKLESHSEISTTDTSSENPGQIYVAKNGERPSKPSKSYSFAEIVAMYQKKSATKDAIAPVKIFRPTSSSHERYGAPKPLRERIIAQKDTGTTNPTAVSPLVDGEYDTNVVEIPDQLRGDLIRLKTVVPSLSTRSCLETLNSSQGDFTAACKAHFSERGGVQHFESTQSNASQTQKILAGGFSAPQETKFTNSVTDTNFPPEKGSLIPRLHDKFRLTDTRTLDFRDEARKLRSTFPNRLVRECNDELFTRKVDLEANIEHLAPEKIQAQVPWDDMALEDIKDENVRTRVESMQTVLPGRGVKEYYKSLEVTNHDFECALDYIEKSKPKIPVKGSYRKEHEFADVTKTTQHSKKPSTYGQKRDFSGADQEGLVSKRRMVSEQLSLTSVNKCAAQPNSSDVQRSSKLVLDNHLKSVDFAQSSTGSERRRKKERNVKPAKASANT